MHHKHTRTFHFHRQWFIAVGFGQSRFLQPFFYFYFIQSSPFYIIFFVIFGLWTPCFHIIYWMKCKKMLWFFNLYLTYSHHSWFGFYFISVSARFSTSLSTELDSLLLYPFYIRKRICIIWNALFILLLLFVKLLFFCSVLFFLFSGCIIYGLYADFWFESYSILYILKIIQGHRSYGELITF